MGAEGRTLFPLGLASPASRCPSRFLGERAQARVRGGTRRGRTTVDHRDERRVVVEGKVRRTEVVVSTPARRPEGVDGGGWV